MTNFRQADMPTLERLEVWARRIGMLGFAGETLMVVVGVSRAWHRPKGRTVGRAYERLPLPTLLGMLLAGLVGMAALVPLNRRVPLPLPRRWRVLALALGVVLYSVGFGSVVWGRVTLGEMYNISTEAGAELYEDHRLVTSGPFAVVRHPMYVGAIVQFMGAVLLYRTWSVVLLLGAEIVTNTGRARREEQALAAEFGDQWRAYARHVPAGLPFVAGSLRVPASSIWRSGRRQSPG
ncbi:isoprenylcysteine carboxylmethyltransferase family protein [Mycobacterium sp. SMC-2]|uniref:methyltransferase family protein n=1 Tax=Mycobacterium sp. SMC-2 TaxID=2857058 RepID=UPI0021B178A2|nr:isoprenylcysteine carboxylmethyltransferase family protein [Mycobacterium sp. SMC-2]UXA05065.1 isoprenylcysteine carboxylmethyltransferase family protein [Mycobacterium sp. SMC-2]